MFFAIVCHLSNLTFLLIFSYCLPVKSSSIGKVCGVFGSTCGNNEACVNGKCECDPQNNFFWTGEKLGCRICPLGYYRDGKVKTLYHSTFLLSKKYVSFISKANRCLKYYSTPVNRSQARENCRREQSDLFTWKDNDDESFLIAAATQIWGFKIGVYRQFYTWSGGIVQNSRGNERNRMQSRSLSMKIFSISGSKSDYRIIWVDPRGPKMALPQFDEVYRDRYCSMSRHWGYTGDPEPTRTVKNGETEDCVTFVFLPQANSRGSVCMADDYCSIKIGYICEMST